jgi:hypothetical protein
MYSVPEPTQATRALANEGAMADPVATPKRAPSGIHTAWWLPVAISAFGVWWMKYLPTDFNTAAINFLLLLLAAIVAMLSVGRGRYVFLKSAVCMAAAILAMMSAIYKLSLPEIINRSVPTPSDNEMRIDRQNQLLRNLPGIWGHDSCQISYFISVEDGKIIQSSLRTAGFLPFKQQVTLLDTLGPKYHAVVTSSSIESALGEAVTFELTGEGATAQLIWSDYSGDDPKVMQRCIETRNSK